MVDPALLWIGLTGLFGLLCLAGALGRYTEANRLDYWGVAGASLAGGGVVELSVANGYLPRTELADVARLQLLLLGGVFAVVAYRKYGFARGRSTDSAR